MQNEDGDRVDIYIPRKCAATNRIIHSEDYASVIINVGHVDAEGRYIQGKFSSVTLSGFMRNRGDSDAAVNRIVTKLGVASGIVEKNTFLG